MWLSKLKKKKIQYFLLGVICAIAIALISVSTIVTVVANTFGGKYYEGDSTPDLHLITLNPTVAEKSLQWYEEQGDEAWNYKNYDIFSVSTNLTLNNKINDNMASFIVPMESIENLSNKVSVIDGDKASKS
ncbi:MAG: hypothetical protein ACRC68_07080, partial [Clostridium sp.]